MPTLRVLISGAGIAGNALAFWLAKLGHSVTVVERYPSLRDNGLQLDLRGHGIEVMRRMGLEQAFKQQVAPEKGMRLVDKRGRQRAFFPSNPPSEGKSGGVQNFTSEFEIMRGDMCHILHDGAEKLGARFIFGTSVETLEDKGASAFVRFADGKTDTFDLVVGADGLNSRTRKMMVGPDGDSGLRPLDGVVAAYFKMPRPMATGEEYVATFFLAPGSRGLMIRRSDPSYWQVYIGGKTGTLGAVARGDVVAEKAAMTTLMRGAGWVTDEVLTYMNTEENDFYLERMALVKLERWYCGRIALVGDAAWCPTANTGMGTTSSIVGAYVLAGEIARHCGRGGAAKTEAARELDDHEAAATGLAAALAAYDERFRPFMDQVQKGIAEESAGFSVGHWLFSTSFGIFLLHIIAAVVAAFRVNVGAMFLKEKVDWELPDYQELMKEEA